MEQMYFGNAYEDGPDRRGWLVGHFMPDEDIRQTNDVEIKWGQHTKGEARDEWVRNEVRTTALVLISGQFTIVFPEAEQTLTKQGDYLLWGPGVDHTWRADEDTVTLTIRWHPTE
jgi:hypothetical protein